MYGLAVKVMPGELWTGKVLCGRARYGLVRSGMAVKAGCSKVLCGRAW